MTVEQGNSQPNPQGGQLAAESGLESTELELDGLLGEPSEAAVELGDDVPLEEGQPNGDEPNPDDPDPEGEGNTPDVKATQDESKVALEDGREVTVKELKETFVTFSRKTQELAETQRATLSQAREAVATYAQQQAHELHLIAQRIEQLVVPGIDDAALQRLAFDNPEQFFQVKARLEVAREMRASIQQQAQQALQVAQQQRQQAQREQQQQHQQLLQTEGAKLAGQKWYTPDFQQKALAFAKKHGIPDKVAQSVPYAGFVEIARKAMAYDEAMARAKGGKQPPAQARVVPGASPARGSLQRAKQLQGLHARAQSGDRAAADTWLNNVL